jgi:hypothetical protein
MPITDRSPTVAEQGCGGGGRWSLSSKSAFRLCFFTGLALELGGALVWTLLARYGARPQRVWLYHQTVTGNRTLFHWLLAIVLPIACVGLARARMPARRWVVTGATLAAGPHFLGYVARFAMLWAMQQEAHRPPDRPPDLGILAVPFLSDMARSVSFVALLGILAALMSALAAGPRRLSTIWWPPARLSRWISVIALGQLLLAPVAAACVLAILPFWFAGLAYIVVGEIAAAHGVRWFRLTGFLAFIVTLGIYGCAIAQVPASAVLLRFTAFPAGMMYLFPFVAHFAYLFGLLACFGLACATSIYLRRRRTWARVASVVFLATLFFAIALGALMLAAKPPPLQYRTWRTSQAAVESWLLTAVGYGGMPLLLVGTAWRFLLRPDVGRFFHDQ